MIFVDRLIIERFVEALQPYSKASDAKEKPSVIPESAKDPSLDHLLAPLKTSRDSKDNAKASIKPTDPKNINRLLNSALSSARNNDNNNNNSNTQQQRKGKRNHDFLEDETNNNNGTGRKIAAQRTNLHDGNNKTGGSNTRNIKQKTDIPSNNNNPIQNNFPPYPPMAPYPDPSAMMGFIGPPGMMSGPPPADPVQYFEHMNQVAIKSGFKNAQEMLAMFHGNIAPPQYPPHPHGPPPPHAPYPYPPQNPYEYEQPPYQQAYHQPPRPHQSGRYNRSNLFFSDCLNCYLRFHSGRSNTYVRGGLGRGRGGADKPLQEKEKESSTNPNEAAAKSDTTSIEASKNEATLAPTPNFDGNDQQQQSESKETSEGDQSQSTWGNSGGRGRGGGRFAAGRGAPRASGGRFGGRTTAPPAATAVFFNPFAQNNNTSLQALATSTAAPVTRAPFAGSGRGGRGLAPAGRAGGNKVWVRPGTEETVATTQQS